MRRNFDLTFTTKRGDFRIGVCMDKSFNERISFKTGYKGQPAKWIKVTAKDPFLEKITSRKEIEHIILPEELEHLWPSGECNEDGLPAYVTIDKSSLKNMFPGSTEMRVLQTLSRDAVPFHFLEGSHYFLSVRKQKKGKIRVINPEDEAMYNLVWSGLREKSEVLIVRYSAMNTNKHAMIYADQKGLRLSGLIGWNYQRQRKERQPIDQKVKLVMYDRLIKSTRSEKIEKYIDDYGEKLEELVEAALQGQEIKAKPQEKLACFARLSALEEDSDEEEQSEKRSGKSAKQSKKKDKRATSRQESGNPAQKKKPKPKQESSDEED